MTKELYIKKIDKIKNLLDSNRLADAISKLMKIASVDGDFKSTDALNQIKQTYSYMMHYMIQGVEDESRHTLYTTIKENLYSIADDLLIGNLAVENGNSFFSAMRTVIIQKLSLSDMLKELEDIDNQCSLIDLTKDQKDMQVLQNRRSILCRQIFESVWTSRKNLKINETLFDWICTHKDNKKFSMYLISALCLSLLTYYDSKKLELLVDIYLADLSESVQAYAMVSLLLALNLHFRRAQIDSSLIQKLRLIEAETTSEKRIADVIKVLMHTCDTERAFTKMRDEVIPELMKVSPDILKKLGGADLDENSSFEYNPDWEDILAENGIGEKMKEISDLHAEGADLMMISFSNLKNFHFFSSVDSWFLPFNINHPAISVNSMTREAFDTLNAMGTNMVESDKYSMALALNKMPEDQVKALMSRLNLQIGQMKQILEEKDKLSNIESEYIEATKLFVNQLYRFYKLFNKKEEFTDPFNSVIRFNTIPVIKDILASGDLNNLSGEYYFKRGYYNNALYWFENSENNLSDDATYWEKRGFCYQKLGDYEAALNSYKKAALHKDPGLWLMRRLGYTALNAGYANEAAVYYKKALDMDPENFTLLFKTGNVLLSINEVSEALRCFYHANYINSEDVSVWRAIAWSELLNGNFEKADAYYSKLLAKDPTANDYMNAGHSKTLGKDLLKASEFYKKARNMNPESFEKDFISDYPTLMQKGVDKLTLDILLDNMIMDE